MTFELYNGDCINILNDMKLDREVDLVLVDLPYGQTACKWDIKINFDDMWKALKRICKKNCIYVFFCTTKFGNEIINSNPKWFRYDIVWKKGEQTVGFLNANKQPLRNHEMVYIFRDPKGRKPTYNPQKVKGTPYNKKKGASSTPLYGEGGKTIHFTNGGTRHPKSVLNFKNGKDTRKNNKPHPTQKPTELLEWLVKSYSNESELILDFCMGSGSTGIACINTNRDFIGVEMDKDIYDGAKEWIESHK
jgi:site-specific DNA-methyltransferase (adenine-specific)